MLKVLVVEDRAEKRQAIAAVVNASTPPWLLTIATDVLDAKRALSVSHYDLLLLDLHLPRRQYESAVVDGGLEIIRWMRRRGKAHRPSYVIALTAYEEAQLLAEAEINNLIWRIVRVSLAQNAWRRELAQSLDDIAGQSLPPFRSDGATFRSDVLVVTALESPELEAVLRLPAGFEAVEVEHDASRYFRGRLKRGRSYVDVVAVAASDKGMSAAAIAVIKGIQAFWPKYVYMAGITAGVSGRT